ncbi:MAG: sugar ABC transporter permease [Clostridia bacterium]|nr:sugar ABC transporter permease [Clostridia bacterium]
MENQEGFVPKKRIKPSAIVLAISAVLLAVSFVCALIFGLSLPKTSRIMTEDGSRFASMVQTGDGDLVYTTDKGNLYRLNGDNELIGHFDLFAAAKEEGVTADGDTFSIRSIYAEPGSEYTYVFVSITKPQVEGKTSAMVNKLFQLHSTEDKSYTVTGHITLAGSSMAITEKGDYLYVINNNAAYNEVQKFAVNDFSAGAVKKGYLYNVGFSNTVDLSFVKNIAIYSFEVVEIDGKEYLNILFTDGLIRISTDMEMNCWEGILTERIQARYDELLVEQAADLEAAEDKSAFKKALRTQAVEEAVAAYSIENPIFKGYDEASGKVSLDFNAFLASESYFTYASDGVSYTGCAYVEDENKYYMLINDNRLYSFDIAKLEELDMNGFMETEVVEGITLAGNPTTDGNSMFYNEQLKVAYVIYAASQKLTRVDLADKSVTFTTDANFDIRGLVQNADGNHIYYMYQNVNEAASGTYIVRSMTTDTQANVLLFKTLRTTFAIVAVVSALVLTASILCLCNPKFSAWLMDVGKGFVRHWRIYLILGGSMSLVAMFCYYPAIGSITMSFFDYTADKPARIWNNFANYKTIFTSAKAMEEFGNMFLFLITDIFTALLPPLIFAFFLTIMRNKGYSALTRTLLFIPGVIPGVATTLIWREGILGADGVINAVLEMFGREDPINFLLQASTIKPSIIFMGFPYVGSYLIFYGAMMNVPDSYYEAAELDGITVPKRFVYIDVPLIFPQIKYVLIMTFIASVQNFGRTYMTDKFNRYGTSTPIHTMYMNISDYGDYGLASAYATVLFVFLFFATVLNMRMQQKDNEV